MKKFLLFFLLFLICVAFSFAQTAFQKAYGGSYDDDAKSVKQTNDGGYIIAGSSSSFTGDNNTDIYLIRTDMNGDTLWTKTYGGSDYDDATDAEQTVDGGFIIAGSTASFGAGLDDIYLIKTDANGDTLWTKTYGGTDEDEGYYVQPTTDGGYIITGSTMSFGVGIKNVYLLKTDSLGNLQWSKTYGGSGIDLGNCVQQTKDGGYIVAGETDSYGAGGFDIYLIKTDSSGAKTWSNTYGGSGDDDGLSIQQTSDGGYIVTGYTASFGAGNYDVCLLKTNSGGSVLWSKAYGGVNDDVGYSVQQTKDGYIVCGYTSNFGFGNSNVYLIKTNSTGDTLWTKAYGGSDYDGGNSVVQTNDTGYIVAGYTGSFGTGNYDDIYLIKTDPRGNAGCNADTTATIVTTFITQTGSATTIATSDSGMISATGTLVSNGGNTTTLCTTAGINEVKENNSVVVFPNPFSTSASLVVNTPYPSSPKESGVLRTGLQLIVYNVMGQIVLQSSIENKTTIINRKDLPDGIYFYRISNESGNYEAAGKLIIQ